MGKSVLTFALVILIIAGLACTAVFGITIDGNTIVPSVMDQENGIRRGLDLVGGSSITYEAQIEGNLSADQIKNGMDSCVAMIQSRLTTLGYSEATVAKSGDKRVIVEIPAITNPEEAVQKLGSTAKLEFTDSNDKVILEGKDIKKAKAEYNKLSETGIAEHYVSLSFTPEAAKKFATATAEMAGLAAAGKNYIAIKLDGEVLSQPSVKEKIDSDSCVISGGFTADQAKYYAGVITSGQMPFALKDVQLSSVGPTLGEKALESSIFAGMIGVLLVMLFMLFMYRLPGVVSCIALTGYITLVAMLCAIFKVNLSLPGIAGIILGIGMAVDANVIIFERIKDELRGGKTVKASVNSGFKRALTAIIDSNITTLIAAVVLKIFGTGPIVGFADTLLIGVITSMFTAVVVSQLLLKSMVGMNIKNIKAYGA